MNTNPLLRADGIGKSYRRPTVLEDASVTVKTGEAVALVGENGCRKTTLLRICAGLLPPDREPGVFDHLTADDHLHMFGTPARGREILPASLLSAGHAGDGMGGQSDAAGRVRLQPANAAVVRPAAPAPRMIR